MILQNNLKRILVSRGTKIKWLSEESGVSLRILYRVLYHGHSITLRNAFLIAETLDLAIEDIWYSSDVQSDKSGRLV